MTTTLTSSVVQRGTRRARKVQLVYVNDFDKGIARQRRGKGFTYRSATGRTLRSMAIRRRIEALAIPPAWEEVWICPQANGHIQAVGRDQAGRKQYIYHERWHTVSSETKFDRMQLMAELLPRIRRRVRNDLRGRKLTEQRALAAVVRLLDKAHIRVGNLHSVETTDARGATTLAAEHVEVEGFSVRLAFPGKSGQFQEVSFTDKRTAKVIRLCKELPGQYLFSLMNGDGVDRPIRSTDVNNYLGEIAGEAVTAKDFRTWWGSVVALGELLDMPVDLSKTERKKWAVGAVKATALDLGNTQAVCRSSYIHPGILAAAESGELPSLLEKASKDKRVRRELTANENRFAALLPYLDFS